MEAAHIVLVTGASGFVGRWLVHALNNSKSYGAVRVVTAGRGSACDFETDVTSRDQTDELIGLVKPTSVVHLAAIAAPAEARGNPEIAWETNFVGTQNVAMSILNQKPDCRLVFAGSSEAYGQTFAAVRGRPVSESMALQPMTTYGATKAAADILLGQLSFEGLRVVRFRPFNHTGPGQSNDYVVPSFASQIALIMTGKGNNKLKVGNLAAQRDFIDVRDVVRAYVIASLDLNRSIDSMVFNLARGIAVSIQDILETLIDFSGIDIDVEQDPSKIRPVEIASALGDSSFAATHLGWRPEITLQQTLRDALKDCLGRIHSE